MARKSRKKPGEPLAKGRVIAAEAKRKQAAALAAQGMSSREIAVEIGMHQCTVSTMLHDPDVLAEIEDILADVTRSAKRRLRAVSAKAARALERVLDEADSDSDRIAAAKTILDRVGVVAETKLAVEDVTKLSDADLEARAARAVELLAKMRGE